MTTGALFFMLGSWAFVLGLTGWTFNRLMRSTKTLETEVLPEAAPQATRPGDQGAAAQTDEG